MRRSAGIRHEKGRENKAARIRGQKKEHGKMRRKKLQKGKLPWDKKTAVRTNMTTSSTCPIRNPKTIPGCPCMIGRRNSALLRLRRNTPMPFGNLAGGRTGRKRSAGTRTGSCLGMGQGHRTRDSRFGECRGGKRRKVCGHEAEIDVAAAG